MDTNWQTQYLYFNIKNIKGRTDCSIVTPQCDLLIGKTNYDMFYIKKDLHVKKYHSCDRCCRCEKEGS